MHAEQLAELFHETYERLAPEHGYTTRKASAVPWKDVPAQNKNLMIAVAREVLAKIRHEEQPVRIWQTATELEGTSQERKSYYIILEDEGRPDLRFILRRHADSHIVAEPYVVHEYDYDQVDCDVEEDFGDGDDYFLDCSDDDEEELEEEGV